MSKQRVLITGATGFIGARIAELVQKQGHDVALLIRTPRAGDRAAAIYQDCTIIQGDLQTPSTYADAICVFKPHALIHAAWAGVAGADRNDPRQIDNIGATAILLEIAIKAGINCFIGLGSQAEYGPKSAKLDETTSTDPTTLYGFSKLAALQVTQSMCRLQDLRHAWLRVFSTYGPRDNSTWMIPSLIAKLEAGEVADLTGCEQIWDFLFIDDAANAALAVLESSSAAGIFNLGSGKGRQLLETVTLLRDLVRPDGELGIGKIPYRTDQVMHLEADVRRLHEATGWRPAVALEDGLQQVVEWHKKQLQTQ